MPDTTSTAAPSGPTTTPHTSVAQPVSSAVTSTPTETGAGSSGTHSGSSGPVSSGSSAPAPVATGVSSGPVSSGRTEPNPIPEPTPAPLPVFNPVAGGHTVATTADKAFDVLSIDITTQCNNLKAALSTVPADLAAAGKAMSNLVLQLSRADAAWAFNQYLKFYQDNITGVCADTVLPTCFTKMFPDAALAARAFHTVFHSLASKTPVMVDPGAVKIATHTTSLMSWLEIEKRSK